jgi:enoyl-CoA hydratase/carnithine racemase
LYQEGEMSYEEILFAGKGPIGIITLNNARKINALSQKMIAELSDALDHAAGDEALKVLILRAAGAHFCAGHDLSEMVGRGMRESAEIFERCSRMMQRLHTIPAAGDRPGAGGRHGRRLPAGGLVRPGGGLRGCPLFNPGGQDRAFLHDPHDGRRARHRPQGRPGDAPDGTVFPAAEAKALGLVNRVVPSSGPGSRNPENLATPDRRAPAVWCWPSANRGFTPRWISRTTRPCNYAKHTIALNLQAEDAQEGIRAFIEKRSPVWKNR